MDSIERQEAIDALNVGAELLKRVLDDADVVGAEREKYEWGLGLIESYISDMKELPSAQPERKKGHWCDCWCSECGWSFEVESGFVGDPTRFLFCPNCGAKMEVKHEA